MEKPQQKTLLSGVKPTGRPHIGNYFGAMKQLVDLQESYRSFVFIADYHALTTLQNAHELRQNILDIALDYLAIGLNPKKTLIFKQSDVPEVTELAWIFNCITTMPYLSRAHAYKDAYAKKKIDILKSLSNNPIIMARFKEKGFSGEALQKRLEEEAQEVVEDNLGISVGTFDYPMLMAADILIYDADVVPVGQDQKQHVEYARDTAEKFNRVFSAKAFKLPEPIIMEEVAIVPGIDGQKMSKSYNNTINLFAESDEIKKAVMGIVTDSGTDFPKNVYAIHKLFRTESELAPLYEANKGKYKALKDALIVDIETFVAPLREKRKKMADDEKAVLAVLAEGAQKAREVATKKMEVVRKAIGVSTKK